MKDLTTFLTEYIKVYSQDVTPNNYLHLLATITYVDYDEWSKPDF